MPATPDKRPRRGLELSLLQGDITTLEVDAIVNAANEELAAGGGVDGAIHRAAGPQLLQAGRSIGHCATGSAVITPSFRLPAKFVIHTVGPVWHAGQRGEPGLLASCYGACMALAEAQGLGSLAFPAISTGVFGYPRELAVEVALASIKAFESKACALEQVLLVFYDRAALEVAETALGQR